ncbi:hypothetical protein SSX86_025811 [Deinandra increscens subsp. villosa]|uniref:Protein CHUP1, chloroplastic n=1 Tax=Deinandra increscens subsp. villosa TaxID=3103831 RepID=A0AAP0GNE1_9ASTR
MGNENRDIAPVLLKFGVALALSFGGVLYSLILNKRLKASESQNDHQKSAGLCCFIAKSYVLYVHVLMMNLFSDCNKQVDSRSSVVCIILFRVLENLDFDMVQEELHHSDNTEFVRTNAESPKGDSRAEKDTHEQEIKNLRNTVKILEERESNLEIKLLEYYGLKEQETVVMELQNRLKLDNMEAKIFTLKIESLQGDNRRLEAQMTDYKKVVADLEAARTKVKMLKRKLKSETEQHKKQILDFHQRVQKMQEDENKHVAKIDPEIKSELCKLKGLEAEAAELRKSNHDLQLEKNDLANRLDRVQILATSVLEDAECEKMKEEHEELKKQNEDLSKEIERLQADRCAEVEELVYLRWINACLRYELRNYQPGPGKTTARDLSRNLSPKSEAKAKQLILEYANKEDGGEKGAIYLQEIDSDQWSNSQASLITDSGEFDDQSCIEDTPRHKKNKFFGKLMRVLRGKDKDKDNHNKKHHRRHSRNSSRGGSEAGGEDMSSCWSPENHQRLITSPGGFDRLTHRHSDSSFYNQIGFITKDGGGGNGDSHGHGHGHGRRSYSSFTGGQKSELTKFAEALKDSGPTSNYKSPQRSPSLTLF